MKATAVPVDVDRSLHGIVSDDLPYWLKSAVRDGLCDFQYVFSDPEFRKRAIMEAATEAAEKAKSVLFEYRHTTPLASRAYHFLFVAKDEDELRGRVSVWEVMGC